MQRFGTGFEMDGQWPAFSAGPVVCPAKQHTDSVPTHNTMILHIYVCVVSVTPCKHTCQGGKGMGVAEYTKALLDI